MSVFASLNEQIRDFIFKQNISTPTPIQEKAIPILLSTKDDVMLLAPTGSGKTEAAVLPLLHRLQNMKANRELFGIYIVYITPLRALNRDVFRRIEDLCHHLGITVAVRHGDTTQYARRKQAIKPPNLLITTPESFQAILPGKRIRHHLRTVFAIVIDEIHELADSKRGCQLSFGLERLEMWVGSHIQRIGLSATVGNPKDVAHLITGPDRSASIIWAGYDSRKMNLKVEMPSPSLEHKELSNKISYPIHSTARLQRIIDLICNHQSTLVFTNTRSFAEVLGSKMGLLKPNYEFDVHHGSLSKNSRMIAEKRLKDGLSRAIIATSSLELGIDIGLADLVIQYSSPREVARALQRVGRAGHGVGRTAKGVFIATANLDDVTETGAILRRARANRVENAKMPMKAWDVLCHQISGLALDTGGIEKDKLLAIVNATYPFAKVTSEELDELLVFLCEGRIIFLDDDTIRQNRKTRVFYYEHLSTIPDVRKVNAVDMTTRASIGVLDEDYVNENVEAGSVFVIRGKAWHVVNVDDDSGEVLCAPALETDIDAPRWVGEMIPVPWEVATEVAEIWNTVSTKSDDESETWLQQIYGLSNNACQLVIEKVRNAFKILGIIPRSCLILIEDFTTGLVVHCPLGTKANEALGIVIASLLTTQIGIEVAVESDPYRILLTSDTWLDPKLLEEVFRSYSGEQASVILRLAMRHTQNFSSRFGHVARRMNVIRKDAKTREIPVRRLIQAYEGTPVFAEAMREVLDEKFDENRVVDLFNRVSKGEVEICKVKTDSPSPLARLIVEEKTRFEVLGEITEEGEVLRMLERRLLSKRFRLTCMANGDWDSVRTVSTMEDSISCPACRSKMIAASVPSDKSLLKLVKRKLSGQSISKPEEKQYKRAALTSTLIARYGKRALLVLAGRGIGPKVATRLLRPGLMDRHELLKEITKAEKEYARTRPFWD